MSIEDHVGDRDQQRPWWFPAALAGILLGGLAGLLTPGSLPFLRQEASPASSCEQGTWPATEIRCSAAQNTSVTALTNVPGPWTARVWLTTLEAVDSQFHPLRQVANHPSAGDTPVWLFIYENRSTGDRVLHVAAAANAARGAFIYIYQWPELGSPTMPPTMPSIKSR
jgi:hypothetical protein